MNVLHSLLEFFLHLDTNLGAFVQQHGAAVYPVLFAIIFIETGFVVLPFLPGDSLLFASGTVAAMGILPLGWILPLFAAAAISGDTVNYEIGKSIGPRIFHDESARWLNRKRLEQARVFYERHGALTIFIARFIPFIRSFAPFVAGIGRMHYPRFISYNASGGITWVSLLVLGGYFFGHLPFVRNHFSLVLIGVIVVSVLPIVIERIRQALRS